MYRYTYIYIFIYIYIIIIILIIIIINNNNNDNNNNDNNNIYIYWYALYGCIRYAYFLELATMYDMFWCDISRHLQKPGRGELQSSDWRQKFNATDPLIWSLLQIVVPGALLSLTWSKLAIFGPSWVNDQRPHLPTSPFIIGWYMKDIQGPQKNYQD